MGCVQYYMPKWDNKILFDLTHTFMLIYSQTEPLITSFEVQWILFQSFWLIGHEMKLSRSELICLKISYQGYTATTGSLFTVSSLINLVLIHDLLELTCRIHVQNSTPQYATQRGEIRHKVKYVTLCHRSLSG
jgi:hypothetical protein